ncbi:MAG: Methyltransferase [Symbiobacteriaceae bacterium]|jgi:SAM-dependent methyltransferase|nr:Methyltransferase [Symbiobacteriaceae bacterium]
MGHTAFYALPEVYEIAFSYRDIPHECNFLTDVYRTICGAPPGAVLELACGPGDHACEFARRGLRVAALDLSSEMTEYLRSRLGSAQADAEILTADMTDFALSRPVDLAITMIDSLPYLATNSQLVGHFRSVRRSVNPGGLYVVELRHPSDIWFPGADRTTVNQWTMERGDLKVTTEWGAVTEHDPITQIERVLTRITVERGEQRDVIESWGDLRPLLPQELFALVDLAGGWRFAGWWGEFDTKRPLGADARDWRMIVAFQAT